jgi:CheY-like chemotaxis protein
MDACPAALRVLVVDDCPDTVWCLASLARMWGHDARTACDGETALRVAAEFKPDVVLVDLGLPGLDGFEVTRRLREIPGLRVRIAAFSGYGGDYCRRMAEEAGCDAYWVKPLEPYLLQDWLAATRTPR